MKYFTHTIFPYLAITIAVAWLLLDIISTRNMLGEIFPYYIEFTVIDASSGRELRNISIEYPQEDSRIPHTRGSFSDDYNGVRTLRGIGIGEVLFRLGSEGYETQDVIFDKNTEARQTIELQAIQ